MQAQIALAAVPAFAQGAQPLDAPGPLALAQRATCGQAQVVLLVDVPAQLDFTATDVVLDMGVVVLKRAFLHALPGFQMQLPAVVQLGPGHQIPAVPAARKRVALAIRLMRYAYARVAPAPA